MISRLSASPSPAASALPTASNQLPELDGQVVNVFDLMHAVDAVMERLSKPESFLLCTLNLDHLVKLRRISEFRQAYGRAEFVTADGFPIVMLARLRGCRIERAAGSDLIKPLCAAAARAHHPIFLLGSTFSVLSASARRLIAECPGLEIAGVYAPPQDFDVQSPAADEAIDLIRSSGARLCFLALGAPRQEIFALRALDEIPNVAFLPIGAGLDFLAGTQIRCPRFFQRIYLEWAWRLLSDPIRLSRRYTNCGLLFVELLIGEVRNIGKKSVATKQGSQ
jgi:N-acetylglucosaminyldiphosphoundecaprenol N-acetyl-beta-D-mannosaminyltransferase